MQVQRQQVNQALLYYDAFPYMNDTLSTKEAMNSSVVRESGSMINNSTIIYPRNTPLACCIISGKCNSDFAKKVLYGRNSFLV